LLDIGLGAVSCIDLNVSLYPEKRSVKPSIVRLVDLGLEADFGISMSFAQSMIRSLTARRDIPIAEIEFTRTRDSRTVTSALQQRAHIVHVMAHGSSDPDDLGFWSSDDTTSLTLTDLAERFRADEEGIETSVLLADCCGRSTERWVRAIRDCIEAPTAYIGSTRSVTWHESAAYASSFYAAYFKDRGRGVDPWTVASPQRGERWPPTKYSSKERVRSPLLFWSRAGWPVGRWANSIKRSGFGRDHTWP
jgi:hypothetical protein